MASLPGAVSGAGKAGGGLAGRLPDRRLPDIDCCQVIQEAGVAVKKLLLFFLVMAAGVGCRAEEIICEGTYPLHLQDVACDDRREFFYWSFTDTLVKTDAGGQVIVTKHVDDHHGGLTVKDGKVYISVAKISDWNRGADSSQTYVYDAEDLSFIEKIPHRESRGRDAIATTGDGGFAIGICDLFYDKSEFRSICTYDKEFNFLKTYPIKVRGNIYGGAQTMKRFADGYMIAFYGKFVVTDQAFTPVKYYKVDAACGFIVLEPTKILVAELFDYVKGKNCRAKLVEVDLTEELIDE